MTDHLIHGNGAVGESHGADDDAEGVASETDIRQLTESLPWRERFSHAVETFFWENGARNCCMLGAAFCLTFFEVLIRLH